MPNLIRAISTDGMVMACVINSTQIVYQAERIHRSSAVVTAALGRLLTAGSMMGCMLKGKDEKLTLKVQGSGPVGALIVSADSEGCVKGYPLKAVVEIPLKENGKLDVGTAVGDGMLYVIRDNGIKEPYMGQVPLISGEIAEDITAYYAQSEQIPTVCGLGVLVNPDLKVKSAGGFLIQLLPGADDNCIEQIENNLKNIKGVSSMIADGLSCEEIAHILLKGFDIEVLDSFKTEYRCDCTREKTEKALLSLGKKELKEIIDTDGKAELCCHFCVRKHRFNKDELLNLLNSSK